MKHLVATMLQRLVDPTELRLNPSIPREVLAAASAEPIPGL